MKSDYFGAISQETPAEEGEIGGTPKWGCGEQCTVVLSVQVTQQKILDKQ